MENMGNTHKGMSHYIGFAHSPPRDLLFYSGSICNWCFNKPSHVPTGK